MALALIRDAYRSAASVARRGAFVGAALATVGLAALGSASAQQRTTDGYSGSPACASLPQDTSSKSFRAVVECEIGEIDRRIQEKIDGAARARAQASASERETVCTRLMKDGIKNGTFTVEAVRGAYGGRAVRDTSACDVLNKLTKT